jgi:hypothetical protein
MGVNNQLGGVTDFIRLAETQTGNQATDIEFTNTFGGETIFIMRGNGTPVSGSDVVNLDYIGSRYYRKVYNFTGNESSSIGQNNSQVFEFSSSVDSGYRIKNGTIDVNINGTVMVSNTDQLGPSTVDFYLSSSYEQVNVRKLYTDGLGLTLEPADIVNISFQQEKI